MKNQLTTTASAPATILTFDDVFSYPQYTLRGIETWKQVASLGSKNITALVSRARDHEKALSSQIASLKSKHDLIRDKSGKDFVEMAKGFSNPTIIVINVPEDSWSKDPEPRDAASINRKRGTTNFNMCGWCKHASGGTGRYSYMITTRCGLLCKSPETRFNTPCLLHDKSVEEIATEVEHMEREVDHLLARRERVREGIKLLQKFKKGAPEKPYLMSLRPHDHFNVGDEMIVYVGQWGDEGEYKLTVAKSLTDSYDSVWVPAIVVFGYRHHDGCVSYQTLFPVHTNMSHYEGRGGGAGMSRPEAILRSEFNYMQEAIQDHENGDLGFVGLWMANIDDDLRGFKKAQFVKDLSKGKMVSPPTDWVPPVDEIEVKTVKDAESVLQCLSADLFKSEGQIKKWAAMQLRHVHPDRLNGVNENVKSYAERQTRAVYAARDLLIARLGTG